MTNMRHSGGFRTPGRDSQGRFTSGNRSGSNSNRNRRNDGYYNLRYHEDEDGASENYRSSQRNRDYENSFYDYDRDFDDGRGRDYEDFEYENRRGWGDQVNGWREGNRGFRGAWASYDEPSYERDRNDTYDRDEDRSRYYGSEGRRGFDDHREFDNRRSEGNSNWDDRNERANRGRGFTSMDEDESRESSAGGGRASHRTSGPLSRGGGSGKTKTSYSQRTASLRRSNRSRNK